MSGTAFVIVEIVMVLGGVLAFAWWELRGLRKEARRREESGTDVSVEPRGSAERRAALLRSGQVARPSRHPERQ